MQPSSRLGTLRMVSIAAVAATALSMFAACGPVQAPAVPHVPHRGVPNAVADNAGLALTSPPARVCGTGVLSDPLRRPRHSVLVPAGNDFQVLGENWLVKPDTVYWFAPGAHTLGTGQYNQVEARQGDVFMGAPGAVLDGSGSNAVAFSGTASHVTIEYLTIEDFVPEPGQYAVNHDMGADWYVEYDTIEDNADAPGSQLGAGLGMGSGDVYRYNCITHNGEYALNAGGTGTTFSHNEVSWNGIGYFPDTSCGCSGGIKYWDATDATIEDNYIHDNYNVGLWADTDNAGFLIKGNYISDNWAEGIIYEISYNADITGNAFVNNGWGNGSTYAGGFPYGDAIYVAGSGGDANVVSAYRGTFVISDNTFTDNWDGLIIYQNPNRLCGSADNSSTGYCTLDDPSLFTTDSCVARDAQRASAGRPDYFDGCQWKAQNITVEGNAFEFDARKVHSAKPRLPKETVSRCPARDLTDTGSNIYWCGFNGMFSLGGSEDDGPGEGWIVADAIMDLSNSTGEAPDNNVWQDNTYSGPWAFQAYVQGVNRVQTDVYPHGVATTVGFRAWRHIWRQDQGSTWTLAVRTAQP